MDIKEIALKIADSLRNKIDGISHMQSNQGLVTFAEALISAHKAELLKEVGEPVGYHYLLNNEMFPVEEVSRSNLKNNPQDYVFLYTSDQLAAAQEEIERLNGQISVYSLSFVELERQRDVEMTSATRWATGYHELRDQLAAAQEELRAANSECDLFRKNGRISDANEIATLKDQLAKAEQRVAEACALQVATETRLHWLDAARVAKEIRSGEWRKFVKEV